jgi:ATP-dependent Clp protease ATP-binding subunit ClpA
MSHTNNSEFEQVLNCSFDRAVALQHEYVTVEHLLACCLTAPTVDQLLKQLGCDTDQLRSDVKQFLDDTSLHSMVSETTFQPKYTSVLMTLVKHAKAQSMFVGKNGIDSMDILLAMFSAKESWAVYFLLKHGVTKSKIYDLLSEKSSVVSPAMSEDDAKLILSQFATNLNSQARLNKIDPLIGRTSEVAMLCHSLSRKVKNNVILVGHPGVGKTQIVEGLALLITQGQVSSHLASKEIWSVDVSSLVAGTKFRGDFEERMKNLLGAIKSLPNVIIFIDEIHMIMGAGAGGSQNSMDVANILKPSLGRGELRCIGSTTHDEFRKHFEKDRALLRRFQQQDISEPNQADATLIVGGLLPTFANYHNVIYDESCAASSVSLSTKFVHNKHLPDKAIDLIDAAGAAAKLKGSTKRVTVADIEEQVSLTAKISLSTVRAQETKQTKNLKDHISNQLFGQDLAVTEVVESVWMSQSGLRSSNKTVGSFLFTGPSGTGKTELAKLLAQALDCAFVRFDMSEFQEKHSVSRLIGSPPGYVGYGDGSAGSGALINQLEQNPQCVLLIDEVEKAHSDVSNIFLQAMDAGVITSANQKTASLSNVILIFTSNLGAADMERSPLGFGRENRQGDDTAAVKQFFSPEFRNRLDAVISFGKLTKPVMNSILNKFVDELNQLCVAKNVTVVIDPAARDWLINNGFDSQMGARPLNRCIDAHIKKPMSQEILFGRLQHGGRVLVTVDAESNQLKLDFLGLCPAGENHSLEQMDADTAATLEVN